jgi:hypothetical protein
MGTVSLRRVLAVATVGLLAALCAASVSGSAVAAGTPVVQSTGALRICSDCAQSGGDLARYGYVVLNSWDAHLIPGLKAANPGLKVLVYKNLSFTVDYSCTNGVDNAAIPAGVGYCDANANHPDWFLKDPSGNRLNSANFTSSWMMDVGNPAYQSRWLANVSAEVKAEGWDGVFADDTNADMGWHLNGRTIAKYPTGAAWRAATRSMLAKVGPALTAQGTLFIPNLYTPWLPDYDALATWSDWIQFTSGAAQEYYSKWGTDSSGQFTGSDWTFRQQFQIATEAAGKIFLGLTYAPRSDSRSMIYARANFLLNTASGSRSALVFEPGDQEASDPYSPAWTADVGNPTGARYQVGAAWRRDFTGGTVVVNPSTATTTVQLGAGYVDSAGAPVTSVTLAPATGAILTSAAASAPTPPTTPTPPPGINLTAARTSTGVQLNWSGIANSKKVDVVRGGSIVKTTANDGLYVDLMNKHTTGVFTYKVCAAGKSTCSAAVKVTVSAPAPATAPQRRLAVNHARTKARRGHVAHTHVSPHRSRVRAHRA